VSELINDQNAKADGGKPHPSYVSPKTIKAIMSVREYGTKKYGNPTNWLHVSKERYHEALLRHVLEMWENPYAIDPESGFPHLYHVLCNCNFLCALEPNE
jgi:hypothetical protein